MKEEVFKIALSLIKGEYLVSDYMCLKDVKDNYGNKLFYSFFYDNELKGYLFCYNKDEYIFITDDNKIILSINKVKINKEIILRKSDNYDTKTKRYL